MPRGIEVTTLTQVVLPVAEAGGRLPLALVILGVVAATFGAALETTLSAGYTLAQFFGWTWGKFRLPRQAVALPLTYLPILIVSNDPDYTGEHVNGRATNVVAQCYLLLILIASMAAIPLLIITGVGQ